MSEESYLVWGLALYGVGLLLVIVEIFVPSGGIIGLLATVSAIAGDVCLWLFDPIWGALGVVAILVLGPLLFFFAVNLLPSTPIGRRLLFGEGGQDDSSEPLVGSLNPYADLLGKEGVTLTDLRPVGTARIDGERHEVLADTHLIEAGARVRVVSVQGNEIKVRKV